MRSINDLVDHVESLSFRTLSLFLAVEALLIGIVGAYAWSGDELSFTWLSAISVVLPVIPAATLTPLARGSRFQAAIPLVTCYLTYCYCFEFRFEFLRTLLVCVVTFVGVAAIARRLPLWLPQETEDV